MYCSKTTHASDDCPVKLAAEEDCGSEDAEISESEAEDDSVQPQQSAALDSLQQQQPAVQRSQPGRATSYSPEVQAGPSHVTTTQIIALTMSFDKAPTKWVSLCYRRFSNRYVVAVVL